MAVIREYLNPFLPGQPAVEHQHAGGITVWEWLHIRTPGFVNFTVPTVCSVAVRGGEGKLDYLLPEAWHTYVIQPDDIITFTAIPGDVVTLFIAILVVLVVAAIVLVLTMPKPQLPGQQKLPNSVYNLEGRQNENKYGQPIPDNYGRMRMYPSYGSGSYNEFDVNGKQILYVILCLGHGEYEIETEEVDGVDVPSWRFGDTNIVNFEGIEVQNCPPSTPVTLFPDNVITVANVQGIELYGPNEDDYVLDEEGYATGTALGTSIGIDIVFPNGLYASDTQGNFVSNTIQGLWEYSTDGGTTWAQLFNFSRTLATNTPQRFTVNTTVPLGVTHIRANRVNDRDLNPRSGNTLSWQALRVFLPSTVDYGNVHMVAFKALATNNLNTQSQATFNFVATRKLPIYDLTYKTWSAPTATRSLVWAFVNVARASYGGRRSDSQIDLEALVALDEADEALGNTFDGQFTQRTGLWDGPLKTIAAAWRGRPMMNGNKLTIVRDNPITLPGTFYNTATIVKDSADLAIETPETDPMDGLEVTYVDEDTLKEETVMCYFPDEAYPVNPDRINLMGVTVRRQAYQEGMIQYARKRYQRMNLSIKVGMEGQLAAYGSMVGIMRDKPRWGVGGRVESITFGSPSIVEVNQPCRFGTNAVAVGTITTTGNATVTVTIDGAPVVVSVAVVDDDTPGMWASRVRKALLAESDVTDLYDVFGTGDRISLKPKTGTAYDATLNIAIANGTCAGITEVVTSNTSHVMSFKAFNGDMMGPFDVLPGVDDYHVTCADLTDDADDETGIDNIPLDDIHERAPFVFGINDFWVKKMIVVGMSPSGKEEVELNLVNYAPEIFAADDEGDYPVPALPDTSDVPLNPALPTVTGVLVAGVPGQLTRAVVSWRAAPGARYYVVETQVVADVGGALSAVAGTDILTKASHGFITGDMILVTFSAGFGGLTTLKAYYCIFLTGSTFKLAKTADDATAGIAVPIDTDGSGGTAIRITDGWPASNSINGLSYPLTVSPSFLIARVAGVNTGQGRWSYWQGEVGVAAAVPGVVSGLSLANAVSSATPTVFDSYEALIRWVSASGGSSDVSVKVYQTDGMLLLNTINLSGTFLNYTVAQAELDVATVGGGAVMKRELTFEVYAVNAAGTSDEFETLAVENAEPAAVTGMALLLTKEELTQNTYRITWMQSQATDIKEYKVYGGPTSGSLSLLSTGLFLGYDFAIALTAGTHAAQYWRVGVVDRWGAEITYCAEQTIPSYP
jgi:hypothetical protein